MPKSKYSPNTIQFMEENSNKIVALIRDKHSTNQILRKMNLASNNVLVPWVKNKDQSLYDMLIENGKNRKAWSLGTTRPKDNK